MRHSRAANYNHNRNVLRAQVCRDGLDAHSARVAELRSMVAEIADEVGCDAADLLRGEVDALGRRLESVRETISTLADIAEAQAANQLECGRNIEQAKSYLSGMQEVSDVPQKSIYLTEWSD